MSDQEKFEQWFSGGCVATVIAYGILVKLPNGEYKNQLTYAAFKTWEKKAKDSAAEIEQLQLDNQKLREALNSASHYVHTNSALHKNIVELLDDEVFIGKIEVQP